MTARACAIALLVASLAVSDAPMAWSSNGESCRTPGFDSEYFVHPDVNGPFVVCDWDEDGLPDIVTLNSRALRLHHNTGRFGLRWQREIAVPVTGEAAVAADISQDGHLDLVVTGLEGTFVFLGDGSGNFVPLASHAIPGSALAVGDMNGDSSTDIVVIGAQRLSIVFDEPTGPRIWSTTVDYSSSLALADFDRDGDLDMATSGRGIEIRLNDGAGRLTEPVVCGCDDQISSVATGDFNHDGNIDVVGTESSSEGCGVRVVHGRGDGTFNDCEPNPSAARSASSTRSRLPVVVDPLHIPDQPHFVTAADLTGDGFEEIVPLQNEAGSEVMGQRSTGGYMAAAADMNGDGFVDVVVGSYIMAIHPGDGSGILRERGVGFGRDPGHIQLADLDRDGRLDVVSSFDFEFYALLTDADGGLGRRIELPSASGSGTILADCNGDGLLDVLDLDGVSLGRADLTFGELIPFPVGLVAWAVGDLNGDRHLDIVGDKSGEHGPPIAFVVMLGNGDGTFRIADNQPSLQGKLHLTDLDRDGHLDLLIGAASLSISYGRGDGTFEGRIDHAWREGEFTIADVNVDGFDDIITGRGQVILVRGRSWTISDGFAANNQYYGSPIIAGNFNGDAWPDLALSRFGSYGWVLAGNGDGTFLPTGIGFGPGGYLAAHDRNGDGLDDIVVSSTFAAHGKGNVTIIKNTGVRNQAPVVDGARGSIPASWPPTGKLVPVSILGVTDADGNLTSITVSAITSDEPPAASSRARSCPAATIEGNTAYVRLERNGKGNGRVYRISFTATDACGASSMGSVSVCVPHDRGHAECVDDGQRFSALACDGAGLEANDGTPEPVLLPRLVRPGVVALSVSAEIAFDARLEVFDILGRRVAQLTPTPSAPGRREAIWDGSGLKRGVYYARLRSGEATWTRTIVLLP